MFRKVLFLATLEVQTREAGADGCYSVVAKRPSHYALASKPHLERMAKEEFFHIGESS